MAADLPAGIVALAIPGTRTIYYSGKGAKSDAAAIADQVGRIARPLLLEDDVSAASLAIALELLRGWHRPN